MPKPLASQAVVITGASSGIGRETALRFAMERASVALAARNTEALEEVARQVERLGGTPLVVRTDVGNWSDVETLARTAEQRFGGIDTWINNAGISEYATAEEVTPEEAERILRVNLLGVIHGCKAALAVMKRQGSGTLINVASGLALRSVPLQSVYCASKHGVKGFTEALRLEVKREFPSINVCLAMPSSTNTPLFRHARSKVGELPRPIPPVYEPRVVAEALVELARSPKRDVIIGGSGKFLALMQYLSPGLVDCYMLNRDRMYRGQLSGRPDDYEDNLFTPSKGIGDTAGDFGDSSQSVSLYTRVFELHPRRKALIAWAGVLGLALALRPK